MPRSKRKDVLAAIRVAGYHGDKERGILLFVGNRVSYQVYKREFDAGAVMRQSGAPCDCLDCRKSEAGSSITSTGSRLRSRSALPVDTSSADASSLTAWD